MKRVSSFAGTLLVFCVPSVVAGRALLEPAPVASGGGDLEGEIRVGPAPGSNLDEDSAEVAEVTALLLPLSAELPECPPGKVGDLLEDAYPGAVQEFRYPLDYWDVLIDGHFVHKCFFRTDFEVDFGARRQVQVEVIQSRLKD